MTLEQENQRLLKDLQVNAQETEHLDELIKRIHKALKQV